MKRQITTQKRSAGITLLEMVLVLGIFGVALAMITSYFWMSLRAQNKSVKSIVAQNSARRALTTLAGEVRSTMSADSGSYPIEVAEGQSLTFYTNIDSDINAEKVRYFLDGTDLKRGVIEPTGQPPTYPSASEQINTIADYNANGASNIFTYYDRDYEGTSSPLPFPVNKSNIRLIRIDLVVDVDSNTPPDPLTVTTEAQLRNLKDNL